jgi:DNA-binding NtrC family response regulator
LVQRLLLFHLVNERHKRRRSMVLTTNKSLGKWGKVLHDEDLADAIIDRILERGRVLTLDGRSVRTSHLGLDEGQSGTQETSDRFSGKTGADFPEPTTAFESRRLRFSRSHAEHVPIHFVRQLPSFNAVENETYIFLLFAKKCYRCVVNILVSWIGNTDARASGGEDVGGGPILTALQRRTFDRIHLLSNYEPAKNKTYVAWLKQQTSSPLVVHTAELRSPSHLGDIYLAVSRALEQILKTEPSARLTFHTSPGTPAMAAVWIILAKSKYEAELISSSAKHGVETMEAPFELAADFVAQRVREVDAALERVGEGRPPLNPAFSDILHKSEAMATLLVRAERAASFSAPVLLEGETGTGKELLARAIHNASPRKNGPFVAINCGAIPRELVQAFLFGHAKGAFTGANEARSGAFREAQGGTLFLDEIGDLPLEQQVNLLRALQTKQIRPVGAAQDVLVDVRILAATHRTLQVEVQQGRFREDLFYRLAVLVLRVPPLRERPGDVALLLKNLLPRLCKELGSEQKKISEDAKKIMLHHPWPGNVREMEGVLARAIAWSSGGLITGAELRDALLSSRDPVRGQILGRPLGEGFEMEAVMSEVARHYLKRALDESGGVKKRASDLLGFANYQTFDGWCKRYLNDEKS